MRAVQPQVLCMQTQQGSLGAMVAPEVTSVSLSSRLPGPFTLQVWPA